MEEVLARLTDIRIVPAVIIDDVETAQPLADALAAGGLPVIEVTLRTADSLRAIEALSSRDDVLVGAGTVTNLTQLDAARRAGAKFIVTPGLDDPIIRHCRQRDMLVIPGAVTPTEILHAQNLGLGLVKFFPCNAFGGLAAIEALAAPFPSMKFLPTGGINLTNLKSLLLHTAVAACGGTWMAKREWIQAREWDKVRDSSRQTVEIIRSLPVRD